MALRAGIDVVRWTLMQSAISPAAVRTSEYTCALVRRKFWLPPIALLHKLQLGTTACLSTVWFSLSPRKSRIAEIFGPELSTSF